MSAPTTQFCRLSVAYDGGQVNLAVPANVPLRLVLAAIIAATTIPPSDADPSWVVRMIDGVEISMDDSIRDAGIRDGALVVLCRRDEDIRPPLYDDIVEAFDRIPSVQWSARDTRHTVVIASGVLSLIAALALSRMGSPMLAGAIAVTIGVVLLAGAVIGPRMVRARTVTPPAAVLACGWVALGTFWCADAHATSVRLLMVFGLLLGLAALVYIVVSTPALTGFLVGVGGLGLTSCLLDVLARPASGPISAAALSMTLAAAPFLPRISMWLARVPRPDPTTPAASDLDLRNHVDALSGLVERARSYLIGLSAGVVSMTAATASLLAATGGIPDVGLAAVAGALVVLRTRHQPLRQLWILALVCTAAVGSVLAGRMVLTIDSTGLLPLALGVMLAATGILARSAHHSGVRRSARLDGWLDRLQTVLALSVVPLLLGVWDVYRALRALAA